MKIAASSICWMHDTLPVAVEKASKAGFTAFEPLVFPVEVWDLHGDLRKMKGADLARLMRDNGMELAALHVAAIMTSTEEKRRLLTDYAKRAIEVAVETGCRIIVECGPDRATEPFLPFIKSLEELVPILEKTNVRIALENHYENWIQYIQDYEHIFQHINHPSIGITLDTGHFTSAGVDPVEVAKRFTDKIFHVHIKDHIGTRSVALGTGQTNNFGVAKVLRAADFKGYFSQELEVEDKADADRFASEGLAYMRTLCEGKEK